MTRNPIVSGKSGEWRFYFPDDGEGRDDARPIIGRIVDAMQVAEEACDYDYHSLNGCWGNGDRVFTIVVISPEGEEAAFLGWHEASVEHWVCKKEES